MSGNEFHNCIEQIIEDKTGVSYGWVCGIENAACAILTMSQMVKIKKFILANLNITDLAAARYNTVALAERHGLDPETVAWALS